MRRDGVRSSSRLTGEPSLRALRVEALILSFLSSLVAINGSHAAGDPPASSLHNTIRNTTFEVVLKKPEIDPITYEKTLPTELLPYAERTDRFRSIGTAFALGHNTYVTAAHVIVAGIDSQYGPPSLRTTSGSILAIDKILKFSAHEDFVVFSLVHDPEPPVLTIVRDPKIDAPVLAVGNALGEGIVVRDGLFTSETPEEKDGQWKWIRFSAAASPGNSGGPLLDSDGQVIGVIVGKSENENLNYALPIARVLDAPDHAARFDAREMVTLPFIHGEVTNAYVDQFALPLQWQEFADAYQHLKAHHDDEGRERFLKAYASKLFPKGPGSEALLYSSDPRGYRPTMIAERSDGSWGADSVEYSSADLPDDGSVAVSDGDGAVLLKLDRGRRASDDAFYVDSKTFMDLALKGLNLRRQVASAEVRITSLGAAVSDAIQVDGYGRRWQQRVWRIPYRDRYVVAVLLPTPNGYVAVIQYAPSSELERSQKLAMLLANQVDVSLFGTLAQWEAYLHRRSLLPASLADLKIEKKPHWTLESSKFQFSVPPGVILVDDNSMLGVTMQFVTEGPRVAWIPTGATWIRDERHSASVTLWRQPQPPTTARTELRNAFEQMHEAHAPYDGTMVRESADTYSVSTVLGVPGEQVGKLSSDVLYGFTLRMDGPPDFGAAARALSEGVAATRILERGHGAEPTVARPIPGECFTSFDAADATLLGWTHGVDEAYGKDVRGRLISDDWADYLISLRRHSDGKGTFTETAQAAHNLVHEQWDRRARALCDYWQHSASSVAHNRDVWRDFLAMNSLPEATPHDPATLEAERRLFDAFDQREPGPDWSTLALALSRAYVDERHAAAARLSNRPSAINYHARESECPARVAHGYGGSRPEVADRSRSLADFYPAELRRGGTEGDVVLSIRVNASGCATHSGIAVSSGIPDLDHAALQWYESASFLPAEQNGRTIDTATLLDVKFRLDELESHHTVQQESDRADEGGREGSPVESRLTLDHAISFSKIPGYPAASATTAEGVGVFQALMRDQCSDSAALNSDTGIRALLRRDGYSSPVIRAVGCVEHDRPVHLLVESDPVKGNIGMEGGSVAAPLPDVARMASSFIAHIEAGMPGAIGKNGTPFHLIVRYEIKLPDGYSADSPQAPRKIDLGPATLEQRVEQQADGRVILIAEFRSPQGAYAAAERSAIGEGLQRVALERASMLFTFGPQRELKSGAERQSLATYRNILRASPQNPYLHASYAFGLDRLCLPEESKAELNRAIQLDNSYAYAHYALGWQLMMDPFCRARAPPFDYAGAERELRESIRLDPESPEYRFALAQLLEHDERGVRFGVDARLAESEKEFEGLRKLANYGGEHDDEILDVLLHLGRHEQLHALIAALPSASTRQPMSLASTALEKGAGAAIAAAKALAVDESGARQLLAHATEWLENERYYSQAAALLEATEANFGESPERDARLTLLKHAQHHEDLTFTPSDPRAPVERALELLLGRTIDIGQIGAQMSPTLQQKLSAEEFARAMYWVGAEARQQAQRGQPADRLIDLSLARLSFGVEGSDDKGYQIRVSGIGTGPMSFFVAREQGLHILATQWSLAPIGSLVLDLLDAHRIDLAREWLDRARECIEEPRVNSLENRAFARLWSRGQQASEDEMRIAAAALAATRQPLNREIRILEKAYAESSGKPRETLGAALAVGYVRDSRWGEAAPLFAEQLQADPSWNEALDALVTSKIEMGEFDAADRAIADSKLGAADAHALRLRAEVAFGRHDVAKARRLLGELVDSGRATNPDRNSLGWIAVAEESPDPKALDVERDLVTNLSGGVPAATHTLACLYAINGRGAEARDLLRRLVTAYGGTMRPSSAQLLQGLLAESYGELALARRFFEAASHDPEEKLAFGSPFMAKMRLELLDRGGDSRKADDR